MQSNPMTILKKPIKILVFIVVAILGLQSHIQAQNDKIEGAWYNDVKTAKIQIYRSGDGKFYGKIVWLKDPLKQGMPKVDEKNPQKEQQHKPLISLVILKGLEKDGDVYSDGTIYDPDNGKTYDCKVSYQGQKLSIRGYIGFSFIGRTTVWERAG